MAKKVKTKKPVKNLKIKTSGKKTQANLKTKSKGSKRSKVSKSKPSKPRVTKKELLPENKMRVVCPETKVHLADAEVVFDGTDFFKVMITPIADGVRPHKFDGSESEEHPLDQELADEIAHTEMTALLDEEEMLSFDGDDEDDLIF